MGIILTSINLRKMVIYDNKNTIQIQSYGPEQIAPTATSGVIVSDE